MGAVADQLKPRRSTFIAGALMPARCFFFGLLRRGACRAHALGPAHRVAGFDLDDFVPVPVPTTAAMFSSVMKSVPKERKGVYTGLTKAWVGLAGGFYNSVRWRICGT